MARTADHEDRRGPEVRTMLMSRYRQSLARSTKRGRYTPEERQEIGELWALGWSAHRIAEKIGRNGISVGVYTRNTLGLRYRSPRPKIVSPELALARAWVDKELEHFRKVRDGSIFEDDVVRVLAVYHVDILLSVRARLDGFVRYNRRQGGP
jgi:hypothetical protein